MNELQKLIKILAIGLGIFIIICIAIAILSIVGLIINIDFFNGKKIDFNEAYENIKIVEIDSQYSEVIVKKGEIFEVDAKNVNSKFTSKEKNHVLTIKEKRNWNFFARDKGTITITIPKNIELEMLKVDTGSGSLEINEINSIKLDVNQGAGVILIKNSNFSNTSIDGGAGKMTITNSTLNNLDLDSGVGEVTLNAKIAGDSEIDCGVGELNITLLGNEEDYQVKVEKGIGSINLNNKDIDSGIYGEGHNKIDIEGGIGSIKINFKSNSF